MPDSNEEFESLFRKHVTGVIRHVMRDGHCRMRAEEATEDAMVMLLERWGEIASPVSWVYTRAHWNAVNTLKAERRWLTAIATESSSGRLCHFDDDPVLLQEAQTRVLKLLSRLPPRQRRVISLWLDGFTDAEIAADQGVAESTVRSNRRHALKALTDWVASQDADGCDAEGGADRD